MSSAHHNWGHVPETFCRQLRQPLCLALLRNCGAADPLAYSLALRLLAALLCLPRLRAGLRAELGAFYPLLLLRCLESYADATVPNSSSGTNGGGGPPPSPPPLANVAAALAVLQVGGTAPSLLLTHSHTLSVTHSLTHSHNT